MKTYLSFAIIVVLAASCCEKSGTPNQNNPSTRDFPSQTFSVTVCDRQPGADRDSTYYFYGEVKSDCRDGVIDYVRGRSNGSGYEFHFTPDPVKLIQTGFNHISFETSAPVNASSSDACLDIVRIDDTHYEIRHIPAHSADNPYGIIEGTTDIRFWNGFGNDGKSITIRVDAQSSVRCEGFEFRIDGRQYLLTEVPREEISPKTYWEKWPGYKYPEKLRFAGKENGLSSESTGIDLIEDHWNPGKGYCFELVGTIPRNATPDNRVSRLFDGVSMKTGRITDPRYDNGHNPFYIWNEARYQGFRWLPKDGSDRTRVEGLNASTQFYPADLRYRKAWIWNLIYKEEETIYHDAYEYFCFFFYDGNDERDFVGALWEN